MMTATAARWLPDGHGFCPRCAREVDLYKMRHARQNSTINACFRCGEELEKMGWVFDQGQEPGDDEGATVEG
jgi:hypothetical protein